MNELQRQFQEEAGESFDGIPINGLHLKYIIWLEEKIQALPVIGSAYLVLIRWDYAPYRVVVFAKTKQGALGKAKRKFPSYEILSAEHIRHCL
jgi:hypothetical protein